eukprot:1083542-Prorocentrum_minimum.AAC.1
MLKWRTGAHANPFTTNAQCTTIVTSEDPPLRSAVHPDLQSTVGAEAHLEHLHPTIPILLPEGGTRTTRAYLTIPPPPGQVGTRVTAETVRSIRRFLSPASPRVCVIGGSRFDCDRCAPGPPSPLLPSIFGSELQLLLSTCQPFSHACESTPPAL